MITPLGSLLLALPALSVVGESTCPAPAQVAERLAELIGGVEARATAGHQASLTMSEGAVVVELRDERAALIGRRVLRSPSCAGLAQAAAAVLAAWEASLPSQAGELAPKRSRRPVTAKEGLTAEERPPPPRLALRVDAGGAVAASGGSVRGGGSLALALGPAESSWWALIAVHLVAPFQAVLGPGSVRWSRPALAAGVGYRLSDGDVQLDVGAQFLAALLSVEGVGYAHDTSARDFDPGLSATLRGSWGPKSSVGLRGWIELAVTVYPRGETVEVGGIGLLWALPLASVDLRAGLSLEVKGFRPSRDSSSP